jgi:light-harvesting protein B-800-850 beta chain
LADRPSITLVRVQHDKNFLQGEDVMADDKVGITGLTVSESEEIHRNLIQGTQIFGIIAALAHLLAYIYSPWLH